LIVFRIQAVMDSPDHCALQLGLPGPLAGSVQSKFEPAKSSSISSVRTFPCYLYHHYLYHQYTFACHFCTVIVTSDWNSALFVIANRGQSLFTDRDLRGLCTRRPAALAARAHAAPTAQPAQPCGVVIFPFVQAACSTSRRTTWRTASRPKISTKPRPSSYRYRIFLEKHRIFLKALNPIKKTQNPKNQIP
jgi:hypothetical protein